MNLSKVIVSQEDHIGLVTINAPETLNALNSTILQELDEAFGALLANKEIRVIVLTGAGRSFVAGADISEMADKDYEQAKEFGARGAAVMRKIEAGSKPVIAAINGFALGGGCELAMACDIRIASEKAKFGQPEVGLGITPGFSGTQRLPRVVGQAKAKELIFTGKIIGAAEAAQIGLVNQTTAPDQLMPTAMEMARTIASNAPVAVSKAKMAINMGWDMHIERAIDLEVEQFALCFNTADQKNGMKAFLNKEKTTFTGE